MQQNRIARNNTREANAAATLFPWKHNAYAYVGNLSKPSKMAPVWSYGLTTDACGACPLLAAGVCYATKAETQYPDTRKAGVNHLRAIDKPLFVPAFVRAIDDHAKFRWHWAGDVQNVKHLAKLAAIARALPNTRFWLPVGEKGILALRMYLRAGRSIPENLTVRLSYHGLDNNVRGYVRSSGLPFSFVLVDDVPAPAFEYVTCPAVTNGGTCASNACEACYDGTKQIAYPKH